MHRIGKGIGLDEAFRVIWKLVSGETCMKRRFGRSRVSYYRGYEEKKCHIGSASTVNECFVRKPN